MNRKRGECPRCGVSLARKREFWIDGYWVDKKDEISYQEGLKQAKKKTKLGT